MRTPFTTPEKLLLIAITIVIGAICGSLYWGVHIVKKRTLFVPETIQEGVHAPEIPEVDVELTLEQKLQLLTTLKTASSPLTKQDRLNVIEKSQSDTEKSTLTVQQKMDVLSDL